MNSLEALEQLEKYITNEKGRISIFIKLYFDIIKQDLERLEALEHYQASAIVLTKENMTLYQENEKLKKAIEILKRFNFSINETRHNNSGFEVWTDSLLEAQELTQQEYELLEEVINNE